MIHSIIHYFVDISKQIMTMMTVSKSIQNSFGKFFINTSLIMMCVNLSEATSEITNQIMTTTSKNKPTTPSK